MAPDEDEPTRWEEAFSDVYAGLDSTGGTVNSLFDALDAAEEANIRVSDLRDRLEDADGYLDEAMAEMDGEDDPDADKVESLITSATDMVHDLVREMDSVQESFHLPDDVDSGVYDTLGGYAEYVYRDLLSLQHDAGMFAQAAIGR